ncbi:MAG: archaetidylserine decarboxylase [Polyangiales bacterium]
MKLPIALARIALQEDLQFLLTNRIPRRAVTRFMGWFSRIEQPLVRDLSLRVWQMFTDLELEDAIRTDFTSMHDCFTRALRPGARPVAAENDVMVSPCDAIVGGCGRIDGNGLIQAKGFPYTLEDLLIDPELVRQHQDGCYVTLRLTSAMYHRFHAPHDLTVEQVNYISGDTWNTHPIALSRVEKLFCKNERAVLKARLTESGHPITLVPVAAILIASIRLHFLDVLLHLKHRGPNVIDCDARYEKGQEMGWFEHGSTIIVFAPPGFALAEGIASGARVRMGEPLMQLPLRLSALRPRRAGEPANVSARGARSRG